MVERAQVDLEAIQGVVQQIVGRFHPQQVILFGSHAYGAQGEDSDVDLLVIMATEGNPLRTAATISAAIDHPFPLDIVVLGPHQLQASLKRGGIFATEIATRGIVLYEA